MSSDKYSFFIQREPGGGMGRGEREREGKPERGKGEGGSASLKSLRAPPHFPGRVVPRTSTHIITIIRTINQDKAIFILFITAQIYIIVNAVQSRPQQKLCLADVVFFAVLRYFFVFRYFGINCKCLVCFITIFFVCSFLCFCSHKFFLVNLYNLYMLVVHIFVYYFNKILLTYITNNAII